MYRFPGRPVSFRDIPTTKVVLTSNEYLKNKIKNVGIFPYSLTCPRTGPFRNWPIHEWADSWAGQNISMLIFRVRK